MTEQKKRRKRPRGFIGDVFVVAAFLIGCLYLVWSSWSGDWLGVAVFKPGETDTDWQEVQPVADMQNREDEAPGEWETITEGIEWNGANRRIRVSKSSLRDQHVRKKDYDNLQQYEFLFSFKDATEITKSLNDTFLQSLTRKEDSLILQCQRISCFEIINEADAYVIQYVSPRDVYDKIVFIDAGHGGNDHGAIVSGISEKDINLDFATRVYRLFQADRDNDIKIYMTRVDDSFLTTEERVDLSEDIADVFISIHNNTDGSGDLSVSGMETYYQSDHSGTSANSKRIAEIFQENISKTTQTKDRGIICNETYYVLNHSKVPAVLTEIGFMTTPSELEKLVDNHYAQKVAEGIAASIKEIFDEGVINGRNADDPK